MLLQMHPFAILFVVLLSLAWYFAPDEHPSNSISISARLLKGKRKGDKKDDTLSLPNHDTDQGQSDRAAKLSGLRDEIFNGPREHRINGIHRPFPIVRGPQITASVAAMIQAEIADIVQRGDESTQLEIGGTLFQGINSGEIPVATMDDLANMYHAIEHLIEYPLAAMHWDSDEAFAQKCLTITGYALRATTTLPSFEVFDAPSITGKTLQELMDDNELYEINLSFAGEFPLRNVENGFDDYYVPGVHALFYVSNRRVFLPLAIHITESGLTYTPRDDSTQWQFAKLAFSSAEGNYLPMQHFVVSHLVMECIRVEMIRHMSDKHPIYALLSHHFKNLFGNSALAFQVLFDDQTTTDQVFGWRAEGLTEFIHRQDSLFEWKMQNLPHRMETLGLMKVPGYKFRDDALAVRKLLSRFVKQYLGAYYKGDDFHQDWELQDFLVACADPGQGGVRGFPTSFDNIDGVAELITDMIFAVTVQHHAMNAFVTWHATAFPQGAVSLWKPLPQDKDGALVVRDFLPPIPKIVETVVLISSFYRPLDITESLGKSYDRVDLGKKEQNKKAIASLQKSLEKLSANIERRESGASIPYTLLKPNRLPYFVWI